MAKGKPKKGVQPKTSPKHAEAELRRELFTDLEVVERDARIILDVVNKLRHGNLDYISKIEDALGRAEGVASALEVLEGQILFGSGVNDDGSFLREDGVVAQMKPGQLGRLPTKKPCIECPLRKDARPGALGGYSPQDYVKLLAGPADVGCHASPGFDEQDHERTRTCTGVAAFRASMGVLAAHPQSHAMEAQRYIGNDPEQIAVDMCFSDPVEFVNHHATQEGQDGGWNLCPNGIDPEEWERKHGKRSG